MTFHNDYERIVNRLLAILERLYAGESLRIGVLAKEFGVCTKTIQRDFYERLNKFPLRRNGQKWSLKPAYLNQNLEKANFRYIITIDLLESISKNIGGDFAKYTSDMFSYLREQNPQLVIHPDVEDISSRQGDFDLISEAIEEGRRVRFIDTSDTPYTAIVEPYAFHIHQRMWYLIAKEGGSIKSFLFSQISSPLILDARVQSSLEHEEIQQVAYTLFAEKIA